MGPEPRCVVSGLGFRMPQILSHRHKARDDFGRAFFVRRYRRTRLVAFIERASQVASLAKDPALIDLLAAELLHPLPYCLGGEPSFALEIAQFEGLRFRNFLCRHKHNSCFSLNVCFIDQEQSFTTRKMKHSVLLNQRQTGPAPSIIMMATRHGSSKPRSHLERCNCWLVEDHQWIWLNTS